jgi:ribonuclease HI
MAQKQKYYVVWKGRRTGIFDTWEETKAQVDGFPGARQKAFNTRAEAEAAYRESAAKHIGIKSVTQGAARWNQLHLRVSQGETRIEPPILNSYSVDAAASGNPGAMEYRCVKTETAEIVFASPVYREGTNNIGEFLASVEMLMLLQERKDDSPIYSDSRIALNWVREKKCQTQLVQSRRSAKLFTHIAHAEKWLRENKYPNRILKWDTAHWGEIPADYGRK